MIQPNKPKRYVEKRVHTYKEMVREAILHLHPEYEGDDFFEGLSKEKLIVLYCNIKNNEKLI